MPKNMFFNLTFTSLQNVTKGARHKIVISIQKLKERQNLLKSLERGKLSPGDGPFLPSWWENGSREIIFSVKSVIGRPYREQQVVSLPKSEKMK